MSGFISKGKEKFHRLEDKFGKLLGRDRLVEFGRLEEKFGKLPGRDRLVEFGFKSEFSWKSVSRVIKSCVKVKKCCCYIQV